MSTFRFAEAQAFQLLWLIPVVVVISAYLLRRQKKLLAKAFGAKISPYLTASVSITRRRWKLALELVALGFFIVALARPQTGESQQKVRSEGIELVFLMDVSNSMLAEDVKPSRLDVAKKEVIRFLESGGGDRVGLVTFAGSAITLSPMTTDKNALKMYVESLTTDAVQTQGTEFRSALLEARNAFKKGGLEEDEEVVITRAIVVVSDGEDNEEGALQAAKDLSDEGIHIFAMAVGTESGGPIPVRDRFRNLRGYRKDPQGQVIMTRTTGKILKELARLGEGSFYHLRLGGDTVSQLRDDLSRLEQAEFASAEVTNFDEQYQVWLFLGFVFALLSLMVGERRPQGRIWRGRFEVEAS